MQAIQKACKRGSSFERGVDDKFWVELNSPKNHVIDDGESHEFQEV